jgi:hypothetical protein
MYSLHVMLGNISTASMYCNGKETFLKFHVMQKKYLYSLHVMLEKRLYSTHLVLVKLYSLHICNAGKAYQPPQRTSALEISHRSTYCTHITYTVYFYPCHSMEVIKMKEYRTICTVRGNLQIRSSLNK